MELSDERQIPVALPREKTVATFCVAGWVRRRAGLDVLETRRILLPHRVPNPDSRSSNLLSLPTQLSHLSRDRNVDKYWV